MRYCRGLLNKVYSSVRTAGVRELNPVISRSNWKQPTRNPRASYDSVPRRYSMSENRYNEVTSMINSRTQTTYKSIFISNVSCVLVAGASGLAPANISDTLDRALSTGGERIPWPSTEFLRNSLIASYSPLVTLTGKISNPRPSSLNPGHFTQCRFAESCLPALNAT
jgi:hypothetical protein